MLGFCVNGVISDIECRDVRRHQLASKMDDVDVTCTVSEGLFCFASRQPKGRHCHDYHVRYYCQCIPGGMATTTPVFIWTPENQIFSNCQSDDVIRLLGPFRITFQVDALRLLKS